MQLASFLPILFYSASFICLSLNRHSSLQIVNVKKMDNNIRIERAIKRISQAELAAAIGVSRQTIFAIENNKYIPSTELALKLSAYLDKTVNELFWL